LNELSKEQQFIFSVSELFMKYGIKSMTMDKIAKALKCSKKTLYTIVKDKDDLVCKVIELHCEMDRQMSHNIFGKVENAIEELIQITNHVSQMIQEIHPSVHHDLEHYYPNAFQIHEKHKNTFIYNCMFHNIEDGRKQGLYKTDFEPEIITKLYLTKLDLILGGEIFNSKKFTFPILLKESMYYHIRGIANEKGIEYLEQNIKKQ
jgi:AcrR family transcriptional regulator